MIHRRSFLAAAAAATLQIVPRHVLGGPGHKPPSEKLNIAGVGVGGQGAGDLQEMGGENIVALCDVDWVRAAGTFKNWPKARKYKDYRRLLDQSQDIDAVMVATPDHMHAPVTVAALRAGKHVYVEKPMAHSIEEARAMTALAKTSGLVTQMGNQGHAGEGLRLTREWIQAGAIGPVREVHCWSDRPGTFWRQDLERPTERPPVRPGLDWDLWLGAAPLRPYHPIYCPSKWRAWFDFGTGALGDMAIHNMDPAFYALDLGGLRAVEARTSRLPKETYPAWQILTYEFAASGDRPAVKILWYDGGKRPPRPKGLEPKQHLEDNGIYFVGDKGVMLCGGWSGPPRLVPESKMQEFQRPPKTIPRSIGHRAEWIKACKEGKPEDAKAGFAYSGPFTEALLVGVVAARLQKRIEWDGINRQATNAPEAEPIIRAPHREGFGI